MLDDVRMADLYAAHAGTCWECHGTHVCLVIPENCLGLIANWHGSSAVEMTY